MLNSRKVLKCAFVLPLFIAAGTALAQPYTTTDSTTFTGIGGDAVSGGGGMVHRH